jgi:hypothetical protein
MYASYFLRSNASTQRFDSRSGRRWVMTNYIVKNCAIQATQAFVLLKALVWGRCIQLHGSYHVRYTKEFTPPRNSFNMTYPCQETLHLLIHWSTFTLLCSRRLKARIKPETLLVWPSRLPSYLSASGFQYRQTLHCLLPFTYNTVMK